MWVFEVVASSNFNKLSFGQHVNMLGHFNIGMQSEVRLRLGKFVSDLGMLRAGGTISVNGRLPVEVWPRSGQVSGGWV